MVGGRWNEDRAMNRFAAATAGFALSLAAGLASATEPSAAPAVRPDRCAPLPREQFLAETYLRAEVEKFGYRVARVDIDRGCYAVVAVDRLGKRYDIRFQGANLWMVSRYAARPEAEIVAAR